MDYLPSAVGVLEQGDYIPTGNKSREIMFQLHKSIGQTSAGILHAVLVAILYKGCNSTEEIHQCIVCNGAFQL